MTTRDVLNKQEAAAIQATAETSQENIRIQLNCLYLWWGFIPQEGSIIGPNHLLATFLMSLKGWEKHTTLKSHRLSHHHIFWVSGWQQWCHAIIGWYNYHSIFKPYKGSDGQSTTTTQAGLHMVSQSDATRYQSVTSKIWSPRKILPLWPTGPSGKMEHR